MDHQRLLKFRKNAPVLLVFLACLSLCLSSCSILEGLSDGPSMAGDENQPQENQKAPDFTLETTDGRKISLHDFSGKPVIVNFWTTWCGPCKSEMPAMEDIHRRYKDSGLSILAINSGEEASKVIGYGQEMGLSFLLLLDSDSNISNTYRVNSIPRSFFIDEEGMIRKIIYGSLSASELDQYVQDLMQAQPVVETAATNTQAPTSVQTDQVILEGCVNTSVLNVRSGPGLKDPVIMGLARGRCELYDATNEDRQWLRLADLKSDKGERLWVASQFIDLKGEIERLPRMP